MPAPDHADFSPPSEYLSVLSSFHEDRFSWDAGRANFVCASAWVEHARPVEQHARVSLRRQATESAVASAIVSGVLEIGIRVGGALLKQEHIYWG